MSETVLVEETYLQTLYRNLKSYINNMVEARILENEAKKASKNERDERNKLSNERKSLLKNTESFDLKKFRELTLKIKELNEKIALIEKPYKEQAKPFKDAQKQAFTEIIKEMVFHGDLNLKKVADAGLLKVK
jgi:hypothetical protein